ncbi:hypothetical protein F5Y11DRAFT_315874 [Daldinia sp. FL1419]|nr:hypothetical protein F5Y11DRAFT_315874 [Daldinia sp. FL1419]
MHIQGFVGALQMRAYQWGVFRFGVDGSWTARMIQTREVVCLLRSSVSTLSAGRLVRCRLERKGHDGHYYNYNDENRDEVTFILS